MVKHSEADIQGDHAQWLTDFALWGRDVNLWQNRHDAVLVELRRLYAALVALRSAARGHGDTIDVYTELCDGHAEAMTTGPQLKRCGADTLVHSQMAARHAHIKGDHERIQEHHDALMLRLGELVESIGARGKE